MATVHRHTIIAEFKVDEPYDPTKPETYQAALAKVDEARKAAIAAGFTLTKDSGQPVNTRD